MQPNSTHFLFFSHLNKVTLSFKDSILEKEFELYSQLDKLLNVKIAIFFSIVIYGLFSILDYLIAPDLFNVFFRIRFVYVIPFALLVLLFFQFKMFVQYSQLLCSLLMIFSGMGIVAMVVLGGEELLQYYYVGLILVLIFNYDFLKLRFVYATFSGWVVVITYAVVCYYSDISKLTMVISFFFLFSANFFGMISAYYYEYILRKNFYANKLLLLERQKTETINKTLEIKVEERSKRLLEANKSLRIAENKYRTMVERSNDLIWTTDVNDKLTFVNHQFEASMSCSFSELESITFASFVHPRNIEIYREKLALLQQGIGVDYSIKVIDHQDKSIFLGVHATPLTNENGYAGAVHFGLNETEMHASEVKRRFIHQVSEKINSPIELSDLASYIYHEISMVIEVTHFFITTVNGDEGDISFLYSSNPELDGNELVKKTTIFHHIATTGKSFLGTKQDMERLKSTGVIDIFSKNCQAWLGVPIKKHNEVLGAVVLVHYENQQAFTAEDQEMMEIISHYISQLIVRQKTENELRETLKKATESDRLKSTFLSTMSHELRTPLNAIIGFSDLINEKTPAVDVFDYAKMINLSGNHLLKIVKDIFNVTLLESGEIVLRTEVFKMKEFVSELMEMCRVEQYEMGKEHLFVDWSQLEMFNDYRLKCDQKLLKQVFSNLLKNALKFTSEGGITFGCDSVQEEGKGFLRFSVMDTGIGVKPDQKTYIFDLFRQVEDAYTRQFGGVGVGLTVAAKLVNLMGGSIWLDPDSAKGSAFYFTLPDPYSQ